MSSRRDLGGPVNRSTIHLSVPPDQARQAIVEAARGYHSVLFAHVSDRHVGLLLGWLTARTPRTLHESSRNSRQPRADVSRMGPRQPAVTNETRTDTERSSEREAGDVVTWLTSLPALELVVGWLAVALLVGAGARVGVRALIPAGEQDRVPQIAAPLMPTLGAAFAIFAALSLASEAGYLRAAEGLVSDEAAASSRLAWAATSPQVHSEPIQAALLNYLKTTRAREWDGAAAASGEDPATARTIARLERSVRAEAARPELVTPASTELLVALDSVTSSRRARIAAASRDLPALYVITLVVSGLALIANAGALIFRSSLRTSLLVVGVASVVGLSLALLFSLSAPWRGPLIVSGHPLDTVIADLQSGFFHGELQASGAISTPAASRDADVATLPRVGYPNWPGW